MKILFKTLKINNFMSFESAELNLDNTGYFIIKGKNNSEDDFALSNGSGKSTVFEALCWVLTGETVRGTKDISNIITNKGAVVEVQFSIDSDDYTIIRKKGPSALEFHVNGEDKSGKGIRDTEKIIETYLPDLSSELIGSVIILGQGLPQRFTNNSPSGRKEMLEKLSKSNFMIDELKDKVSNRKKYISNCLRTTEDNLLVEETNKKHSENLIEEVQFKIDNLKPIEELTKSKDELFNEKVKLENHLEVTINHIKEKELELSELNNNLQEYTTNFNKSIEEIKDKYSVEIKELEESISNNRVAASMVQKEIDEINNIKDVCPTCGQKIQGVHKPDTTEKETLVESYREAAEDFEKDLKVVKSILNDKIEEVTKEYNELTSTLKNNIVYTTSNLNNCIDDANEAKASIEQLSMSLSQINNEIDTRNELLKSYEEILNKNKDVVSKCEENILYNNNEHEKWSKHLEVIDKIFSMVNKEFRGYLLINVIQYINNVAKKYCQQVFHNNNLNFELKGNNISISYCSKEYETLSGGEKQKIDIIIQFAIRDMLSKYLNFSSNILVLDEVTDFLDTQGVNAILELITNNLTDIQSIYFITHHEDLMFPYDGELLVIKDKNGISSMIRTQ